MALEPHPTDDCALCGPPIELEPGLQLSLRHTVAADADQLQDLYRQLGPDDIRRRFFTAAAPPRSFFENWAAIETQGGLGLLAEQISGDAHRPIAEAGYALVAGSEGDGEIGIAVDPESRGWLGPWMLDRLLAHAQARGVVNLQAVMLVDNKAMRALAARHSYVTLDHPDWNTVRITMATDRSVPHWSGKHDRPRVLVETDRSRWGAEEALARAGYDVALCNGPCRSGRTCPVLHGEPCPLIEGADVVVVDLPEDDDTAAELLRNEQLLHPGIRLVAAVDPDRISHPRLTPAEILEEVADQLGRSPTGDSDET